MNVSLNDGDVGGGDLDLQDERLVKDSVRLRNTGLSDKSLGVHCNLISQDRRFTEAMNKYGHSRSDERTQVNSQFSHRFLTDVVEAGRPGYLETECSPDTMFRHR